MGRYHAHSRPPSSLRTRPLSLGLNSLPLLWVFIHLLPLLLLDPSSTIPPCPCSCHLKTLYSLHRYSTLMLFIYFFPYQASSTGLQLSAPNGNHSLPTPLGFPHLIRSRPPLVGISLACAAFVYTPSFGFLLLCWKVIFSCPFSILATPRAPIYSVCVRVRSHDHVKPQLADVSLSFLPVHRSTQLLQHPTVCTHFKGRRVLDSWAQTAEKPGCEPACGFYSKTLTWLCVGVRVPGCVCERVSEWESRHDVWQAHMKAVKGSKKKKKRKKGPQTYTYFQRCMGSGVEGPQKGDTTQTRGRQEESVPEGRRWQLDTTRTHKVVFDTRHAFKPAIHTRLL